MKKANFDLLALLPKLSDRDKRQRTLAALADVDAGRTIPHEEVMSWVQSLFKSNRGSNNAE
jgi:predicted transcriptional regulator